MAPCKVILVRHGETVWNQEGRFLGQSDLVLNEKGGIQAQEAADLLVGEKIDLVFSSDLLRALITSRAIASIHNTPVRIIPSLREINFGDWEGLTFKEIKTRDPALLNEWLEDPFKVRIPGGETAQEVWCRVIGAWNSISDGAADQDTVVIVAHGGPLRLLLCHLTGVDSSRQWEFNLRHGEALVLVKNGDTYSMIN